MIFKQLDNQIIEKKNYKIVINNIEAGGKHWGNEKYIEKTMSSLEEIFYDKDNFNNNICKFASLITNNSRIEDILFYREGDKIILLAISDIPNFKETEVFTRYMEASFRNQKQIFIINEITSNEYLEIKKGKVKMPENWILDEKLTNRFNTLKSLF